MQKKKRCYEQRQNYTKIIDGDTLINPYNIMQNSYIRSHIPNKEMLESIELRASGLLMLIRMITQELIVSISS